MKLFNKFINWLYDKLLEVRADRKDIKDIKFKIFNNHWKKIEKDINDFCYNKIIIKTIQTKASEEQHVIIGVWYEN
jgi:hypothetical protein